MITHDPNEDYHVHISTTNESFLKLYNDLRKVGVKNNKFFLKLYDKSLENVDPLDEENLTADQKARIWVEVKRNPWYFFREVCRVPVAGGGKRFALHRGNLAFVWAKLNNLNFIGLLPRQNFKTITVISVDVYIYYYGTTNTEFIYSNKDAGGIRENILRFKKIAELIPSYLKIEDEKNDVDNATYQRSNVTKNSIKASSSPANKEAADKAGRGLTSPILFLDEFAFLKYNETIYGSAYPVYSQASIEAKNNGKPYGITIITTPNNLNLPNAQFCKMMIDKGCKFKEEFYDMEMEDIREYIKRNSENGYVHIEFQWHQIGRNREWYESQVKGFNGNQMLIKREIELHWPSSDEDSIFSERQLDRLLEVAEEQSRFDYGKITIDNYYDFQLTRDVKSFNHSFMFVVDPSGGTGRDDTAIVMIDPVSGLMYGKFLNSTMGTPELVSFLTKLVTRYFRNSFVVVERNSIGLPALQLLLKSSISHKLFYTERNEESKAERTLNTSVKYKAGNSSTKRIYGFNTNKTNRDAMTNDILFDLVNNTPEVIADIDLYYQISSLVRTPAGKIEHAPGKTDDLVMAMLISQYVLRFHTKDISKFLTHLELNEEDRIESQRKRNKVKTTSKFITEVINSDDGNIDDEFMRSSRTLYDTERSPMDDGGSIRRKLSSIINLNS